MASRGTIRTRLRRLLSVDSDDPEFDDDVLNEVIQEACDSLVEDINLASPGFNHQTVTLEADSSTSHVYTFATQDTALSDFAKWVEVRWDDEDGLELHECRVDELKDAGSDHFAITGPRGSAALRTSPDSEAGKDVWMRYSEQPDELSSDASVPSGVPTRFHDLIALEAMYAFALGGEQRMPPDLRARWMDRRAQLIAHVGRRGSQVSRSRIYADPFV